MNQANQANQAKPNKDFPSFQKYAIPGDKIQWVNGEFLLTATIRYDDATKPDDSECYDEFQIEAFKNDDWFYCGNRVYLNPRKHGTHGLPYPKETSQPIKRFSVSKII